MGPLMRGINLIRLRGQSGVEAVFFIGVAERPLGMIRRDLIVSAGKQNLLSGVFML